jgi:hypothetical protein
MLVVLSLAAVCGYGFAMAVAYERWHWRGAATVFALPLVANFAAGTFRWWRAHNQVGALTTRGQDWLCQATNLAPSALFVGVCVLGGLWLARESSDWRRRGIAVAAAVLSTLPALWIAVVWVIGTLRCDAL